MNDVRNLFDTVEIEQQETNKYLLFRLSNELYAAPLLTVKQVIEPQTIKAIPNTAPYFVGLINYRGQIHGLVDMRIRFQCDFVSATEQSFLIFDSETGPIAAIVDHVEAVISLDETKIDKNPNIKSKVPPSYLIGIGTYNSEMITIVDLNKAFSKDDFVEIQSAKLITG